MVRIALEYHHSENTYWTRQSVAIALIRIAIGRLVWAICLDVSTATDHAKDILHMSNTRGPWHCQ